MRSENNPEIRNAQRESASLPLFHDSECNKSVERTADNCNCEVAHARRSDPQTSRDAAKSVTNLGRTRDRIIALLKAYGPLTDEHLVELFRTHSEPRFGMATPAGIRSRRCELVRWGFVVACGEGKTASGRACQIWRLK